MPSANGLGFYICVDNKRCNEYFFEGNNYIEAKDGTPFKIEFENRLNDVVMVQLSFDGKLVNFFAISNPRGNTYLPGFYIRPKLYKEFIFAVPPTVESNKNPNISKDINTMSCIELRFYKAIPLPVSEQVNCVDYQWDQQSIIEDKKFYYQTLSTKSGTEIKLPDFKDEKVETINYNVNQTLSQLPIQVLKLYYQNREALVFLGVIQNERPGQVKATINLEDTQTVKMSSVEGRSYKIERSEIKKEIVNRLEFTNNKNNPIIID